MPVTRELSITYAGVTIGGSTARQITEFIRDGDSYETAYVEFEFVTTASSAASLATEIDTLRTAFRTPRGDFVLTMGGSEVTSLKQSNNTGFDASPEIIKDGDPADTGRSRHFRIRIEFGRPATVSGTAFRRWATINVQYDPSRRRTVTISGTYTANSTDGTTTAFDQYRAQITTYANTVLDDVDDDGVFEVIGEPVVEYGETNKVLNFSIVYREIIYDQSTSAEDDLDIVDPILTISVERVSPGDSVAGGAKVSETTGGAPSGTAAILNQTEGNEIGTRSAFRPIIVTINYECSINKERTTNLEGKWAGTIRPFIIRAATTLDIAGKFVVITDRPSFDFYNNRITAFMQILSYGSSIFEQKITVADSTNYGKTLVGVWTKDPFDYYEYPGSAVRVRTYTETRKQIVDTSDPNKVVDPLVRGAGAKLSGIKDPDRWTMISRTPAAAVMRQGLDGKVNFAEVTVETVAQYRKLKAPSVADAGGITGGVGT